MDELDMTKHNLRNAMEAVEKLRVRVKASEDERETLKASFAETAKTARTTLLILKDAAPDIWGSNEDATVTELESWIPKPPVVAPTPIQTPERVFGRRCAVLHTDGSGNPIACPDE